MKTNRPTCKNQAARRRGTAAVEAALVLPLLIIVTFGAIDLAQYINLAQLVSNASREGARVASRNTTGTVEQVEDAMIDYISDAMPHLSDEKLAKAIDIRIRTGTNDAEIPAGNMRTIPSGDPISVYVEFEFDVIRWLAGPSYWNSEVKDSKTYCRRE